MTAICDQGPSASGVPNINRSRQAVDVFLAGGSEQRPVVVISQLMNPPSPAWAWMLTIAIAIPQFRIAEDARDVVRKIGRRRGQLAARFGEQLPGRSFPSAS